MSRGRLLRAIPVWFPLILAAAPPAESSAVQARQGGSVVILHHADSLVGMQIGGEQARELIGNVRFSQGGVVVTCDRAIQYMASNRVSLQGVVEVRDDSMRMVGMRGMYYGDTRTAEAFERVMLEDRMTTLRAEYGKYFVDEKKAYFTTNVAVEDTGSTLTSDTLTYFREEQHAVASGHVAIVNRQGTMRITGNHFENFRKRRYSRMTERPEVVQTDSGPGGTLDTLVVRGKLLESYQDSVERLVATDSVTIVRGGFAAEAGLCEYLTGADSIVLRRSPVVWYAPARNEDNQISGDSTFIRLKGRRLETVNVRGRAFAISRADSLNPARFNQLTGQEIVMRFGAGKLESIDVDRTATSVYYLFEGGEPNGINRTSGDHITFTFLAGRLDRLRVTGGIEGQYYPEKLVRKRESEYNLPGFNWRSTRPGRGTSER